MNLRRFLRPNIISYDFVYYIIRFDSFFIKIVQKIWRNRSMREMGVRRGKKKGRREEMKEIRRSIMSILITLAMREMRMIMRISEHKNSRNQEMLKGR